jgi:hypothetical protein
MIKTTATAILAVILSIPGYSQDYDVNVNSSSWEIAIYPNITQRATITHNTAAKYPLESSPQISGEIGINRMLSLGKRTGFLFGLHFGIAGNNGKYSAPESEIGGSGDEIYYFNGGMAQDFTAMYIAIPFLIEQKILLANGQSLFIQGGPNVRAAFGSSSRGDMDVMEINLQNNKNIFINFTFAAGFQWKVKADKFLKCGLYFNLDPSYIAKGDFFVKTASSFDSGTYKVQGNCIGLMFSFGKLKYR